MLIKNKIIKRVSYFLGPLIIMIASNGLIYSFVLPNVYVREVKAAISAFLGLILFAMLIKMTVKLARMAVIPIPKFGTLRGFAFGILLGLIVSISSAFLFLKTNHVNFNWTEFKQQLPFSTLVSVAPATVEEVVFRFGIVHGTAVLAGPVFGLMAGSLPFGLGHLLNRLIGQPISLEQVLGITVAGLLLSLLFLKHGLWAAIACHYVWNALSGPWIKAMGSKRCSGHFVS